MGEEKLKTYKRQSAKEKEKQIDQFILQVKELREKFHGWLKELNLKAKSDDPYYQKHSAKWQEFYRSLSNPYNNELLPQIQAVLDNACEVELNKIVNLRAMKEKCEGYYKTANDILKDLEKVRGQKWINTMNTLLNLLNKEMAEYVRFLNVKVKELKQSKYAGTPLYGKIFEEYNRFYDFWLKVKNTFYKKRDELPAAAKAMGMTQDQWIRLPEECKGDIWRIVFEG